MFPYGTRLGYSIMTGQDDITSVGIRYTDTIVDKLFIARYSAPLYGFAFWIRSVVGVPTLTNLTFTLYADNGDFNNPGTPLETVSGLTGNINTGRLVVTGFSTNLVKGRRYRLRITTSNSANNNYAEFLLGPPMETGTFNDSTLAGYATIVRFSGTTTYYNRFNMQVIQTVGSQQVSDQVLHATSGASTEYVTYSSHTSNPFGIRVTMPSGANLRYWGFMISRVSYVGQGASHGYWIVKKGSNVVGVTNNYPGVNASTFPDTSPNWGRIVYRFSRSLVLEGGQTYDFIFNVAGLHNASNYASFLTCITDNTYVPQWFQRYKLLVSGSEVTNRALPTFFLYLDDPYPSSDFSCPDSGSGIVNPYVMMPVG